MKLATTLQLARIFGYDSIFGQTLATAFKPSRDSALAHGLLHVPEPRVSSEAIFSGGSIEMIDVVVANGHGGPKNTEANTHSQQVARGFHEVASFTSSNFLRNW